MQDHSRICRGDNPDLEEAAKPEPLRTTPPLDPQIPRGHTNRQLYLSASVPTEDKNRNRHSFRNDLPSSLCFSVPLRRGGLWSLSFTGRSCFPARHSNLTAFWAQNWKTNVSRDIERCTAQTQMTHSSLHSSTVWKQDNKSICCWLVCGREQRRPPADPWKLERDRSKGLQPKPPWERERERERGTERGRGNKEHILQKKKHLWSYSAFSNVVFWNTSEEFLPPKKKKKVSVTDRMTC